MADPTIVVVDDASELRSLVKLRLRLSRRLQVVGEGADGADAVALAERHQPALMLLDVSMPRMDGLEALPRILEVSPRTRVVMYTGFDEQGLAQRAIELGATDFIEKGSPIDELADRLLALVDAAPVDASVNEQDPSLDTDDERSGARVLSEHLERFREVFEAAAIGMGTMTLTGTVVRANRTLADLLGRDLGDLVGRPYVEIAGADESDIRAALERVTAGGADTVGVEHDLTVDHGVRRVHATLAPVRGSDRRALYVFLQVQDVTAQRAAEEQLRQSEERFRLLVEVVQDYAIFMLDPTGHVASWNAGAQRAKGWTESEILGRHFRLFYPPDKQAEQHPEHELELALRDGRYEEEGWRIRKDGSRFWANVVITAIRNAAGQHIGFAKVTRDVTERRRMLEQLELVNSRLQQATEEQRQFLAVTAHELRMPIGVLSGSASTLARHWAELDDDERLQTLAGMTSSADRLRRLLADLLTISRIDAGAVELDRRPVSVRDVLASAVQAARQTDTDADVAVEWCADDLFVLGDADRLAQAIDNLVANGLRHGRPPVRLSAARDGGRVRITVADGGPGVPVAFRDQLFSRFSTGARAGGTGLGLFIVRELVRIHGGEVSYDPPGTDGWGGAFVVTLPLATN